MQGVGSHRHHASTLRVAHGHLAILDGEQDEDEQGQGHEERRVRADTRLLEEDAGRIIDRGADVGEDDAPAQERAEPAPVASRLPTGPWVVVGCCRAGRVVSGHARPSAEVQPARPRRARRSYRTRRAT